LSEEIAMLRLQPKPLHSTSPTPRPQKRLNILGAEELDALYGLPRFTPEERQEYFALSATDLAALAPLHSPKSRLYGILQLGYFRARHQFFVFRLHEVAEDARYLQALYFPTLPASFLEWTIPKSTRLRQQRLILALCQYHPCEAKVRRQLQAKARQAARVSSKPVYLLRTLLHYLNEQYIVVPGYRLLQETISHALTEEQHRLSTLLRQHLIAADHQRLQCLLADAPGLYAITQLKREPRDFRYQEIQRELRRREQLHALYAVAQRVLPALAISNESITYYASLVSYYSVYKLKRMKTGPVALYLLCFIYHRYQRLHDHLFHSLLYHVRQYTDEAKEAAEARVAAYRLEGNQNLHKAGQVLKLFTDNRIAAQTPFGAVQAQAFAILPRPQLEFVADHIATDAHFDETAFQWEHIDVLAPQFKRHLRPIMLAVDFGMSASHAPLRAAVQFLKNTFRKGQTFGHVPLARVPLSVIPETSKRYLYRQDTQGQRWLLPNRYEFLIYRLLRNGLESGDVFCRESVRFRSFEDDLLTDHQWQQKEHLLIDTDLPLLRQPVAEHLAALEHRLETRLAEVNQRIASGENSAFQLNRRNPQGRWTLQYPQSSEPVNHPFFDALHQVDISQVLAFVHRHCRFMEAFEHVLGRNVKQPAEDRALTACLIAWSTNMGLGKMGDISDLSYQTLATTSENFLRLETLREANDRISNATAKLPIFHHYDIGGTVHSSSDGQKFETRFPTINARHSPKYFGLHKGVVAYTVVANHIPINARIIGANEHESHYVFDLLFNNTTDIQPEVHSTDTHGTNEVNFALLHLFGYQFAPRYRDFYDQVRTTLYGFKHPRNYTTGVLRPVRKINTTLITEDWDNIQRIMVSLALKTTTQSIIVGKLSAYARKNKTRRALWEYDNIIRSLYLLEYLDSPPLRQNVQRALNRGENYHQLRRAVAYANFGKLRFRTEHEQHLWGECSRLLTNCIIYYNASILSNLLTFKEARGDAEGVALLARVSPVAWQHINWHGRYEFRKPLAAIDMHAIIQTLTHVPIFHNLAG
jgi:TnpA family transposase